MCESPASCIFIFQFAFCLTFYTIYFIHLYIYIYIIQSAKDLIWYLCVYFGKYTADKGKHQA